MAAGVGHIVLISPTATRAVAEPSMYAADWTGEQHLLRVAALDGLRMNYFAESLAQMAPMLLAGGVLTGLGEGRVAYVSRDDLCAAAAGILIGPEGRDTGAIYSATGNAALSGDERAAVIGDAAGAPMRFLVLGEDELRGALGQNGVPADYIESMIEIEQSYVAGSFDIVTGDVERLAGRPPRTLHDILSAALQH